MPKALIVVLLGMSVLWSAVAGAQSCYQPPLVRFSGLFLPVEERGRSGVPTLRVLVAEKRWIFRIAKVENLTGRDLSALRLLQVLFPPHVHFVGPEEFVRPLQDPEVAGKRLRIEGLLYTADRVLLITAMEVRGD